MSQDFKFFSVSLHVGDSYRFCAVGIGFLDIQSICSQERVVSQGKCFQIHPIQSPTGSSLRGISLQKSISK